MQQMASRLTCIVHNEVLTYRMHQVQIQGSHAARPIVDETLSSMSSLCSQATVQHAATSITAVMYAQRKGEKQLVSLLDDALS